MKIINILLTNYFKLAIETYCSQVLSASHITEFIHDLNIKVLTDVHISDITSLEINSYNNTYNT